LIYPSFSFAPSNGKTCMMTCVTPVSSDHHLRRVFRHVAVLNLSEKTLRDIGRFCLTQPGRSGCSINETKMNTGWTPAISYLCLVVVFSKKDEELEPHTKAPVFSKSDRAARCGRPASVTLYDCTDSITLRPPFFSGKTDS